MEIPDKVRRDAYNKATVLAKEHPRGISCAKADETESIVHQNNCAVYKNYSYAFGNEPAQLTES